MTPQQLIAEARTYLGTPWRHQGRTKEGLDCPGLIIVPALTLGWKPVGGDRILSLGYRQKPSSDIISELMDAEGMRMAENELQPGDVVLMRVDCPFPDHLALVTEIRGGVSYIIHASAKDRRVVENAMYTDAAATFVRGYRFWDFCNG